MSYLGQHWGRHGFVLPDGFSECVRCERPLYYGQDSFDHERGNPLWTDTWYRSWSFVGERRNVPVSGPACFRCAETGVTCQHCFEIAVRLEGGVPLCKNDH
jgi:hypothetical protein